jgi:TetR/AcrR family transcriptional repressor of nem operon
LAKRYTEDGRVSLAFFIGNSADPGAWIKGYTDIFRKALVDDNLGCAAHFPGPGSYRGV